MDGERIKDEKISAEHMDWWEIDNHEVPYQGIGPT